MRVSRTQAAEHRERIIDMAARMFRKGGFAGVGLDAVMRAAGLTHGGFYGHFASKDELAAAALDKALQRSAQWQSQFTSLRDLAADYLSERHLADRANGCAIAALAGETARQGEPVRRGMTRHVRAQVERIAALLGRGPAANRRKRAIVTLAALVGALTLARAVDDAALSNEILAALRERYGKPHP